MKYVLKPVLTAAFALVLASCGDGDKTAPSREQLLSQLQFSGSQMTFSLSRFSACPCP